MTGLADELAFGAALRDVLIKLTGQRNPQSRPEVVRAMSQPGPLVEQFQYQSFNLEPTDADELVTEELLLKTRSDAEKILRND